MRRERIFAPLFGCGKIIQAGHGLDEPDLRSRFAPLPFIRKKALTTIRSLDARIFALINAPFSQRVALGRSFGEFRQIHEGICGNGRFATEKKRFAPWMQEFPYPLFGREKITRAGRGFDKPNLYSRLAYLSSGGKQARIGRFGRNDFYTSTQGTISFFVHEKITQQQKTAGEETRERAPKFGRIRGISQR